MINCLTANCEVKNRNTLGIWLKCSGSLEKLVWYWLCASIKHDILPVLNRFFNSRTLHSHRLLVFDTARFDDVELSRCIGICKLLDCCGGLQLHHHCFISYSGHLCSLGCRPFTVSGIDHIEQQGIVIAYCSFNNFIYRRSQLSMVSTTWLQLPILLKQDVPSGGRIYGPCVLNTHVRCFRKCTKTK